MSIRAETVVVLLPGGRVRPFWIVDRCAIADDGTLNLFDTGNTHAPVADGDWEGFGALTLADGVRLTDRDGNQVPPDKSQVSTQSDKYCRLPIAVSGVRDVEPAPGPAFGRLRT